MCCSTSFSASNCSIYYSFGHPSLCERSFPKNEPTHHLQCKALRSLKLRHTPSTSVFNKPITQTLPLPALFSKTCQGTQATSLPPNQNLCLVRTSCAQMHTAPKLTLNPKIVCHPYLPRQGCSIPTILVGAFHWILAGIDRQEKSGEFETPEYDNTYYLIQSGAF